MEGQKQASKMSKTLNALPDYTGSVSSAYVLDGYLGMVQLSFVPLLMACASLLHAWRSVSPEDLDTIFANLTFPLPEENPFNSYIACSVFVCAVTAYMCLKSSPVYLLDFTTHKAPKHLYITKEKFSKLADWIGQSEEAKNFQLKILERSGLGDRTAFPPAIMDDPPRPRNMQYARKEFESVVYDCMDQLFERTGLTPKEIDIVIVNCSMFAPTPSLAAMVVNHYKMRSDCLSYNLGGMGCSAGGIAIDLAKHLLNANRNKRAVVVSTENVGLQWYTGEDRSMLMTNCIFRVGGAAILLSNHIYDRWFRPAKYELLHTVRTNHGKDDKAYGCIFQDLDETGKLGVSLSKELMTVAGETLKTNITTLGPLVLPFSEQFQFFLSLVKRKVFKMKNKPYIPDFKKAFEHFCIHAGGRAVIDAIEKNLSLPPHLVEPSRQTLQRFGNTSSSSVWYELSFTEGKGNVKKGDRVWQIAFGSGFKCNSCVWRALRPIEPYVWDE